VDEEEEEDEEEMGTVFRKESMIGVSVCFLQQLKSSLKEFDASRLREMLLPER
jgi:hypothetical protein